MSEKIEWYKEVLELEPNSRVFFPLARMLAEEGMRDEAAAVLEKGLERHPEYLEARLFLIELLFTQNKNAACNIQVRQLSRMFASYAGFWQAWAACLAQEPSEEDAASMLRFLAANFISGPLRLHDVINKGLQAIIDEKRNAENPAACAEAEAAEHLLARNAASINVSEAVSAQPLEAPAEMIADVASIAEEASAAAGIEAEISPQIDAGIVEADLPPVEVVDGGEDLAHPEETLEDSLSQPLETDGVANESEVIMAQAGQMVAEETPEMAEEAAGGTIEEIVEEEGGIDADGGAEALLAEIPEDSSKVTLEESVAGILENALEEDFTEASLETGLPEEETTQDFADDPRLGGVADAEILEAQAQPLVDLDLPEVPYLDAAGEYAAPSPEPEEELTESVAFDALIDDLADQSRELSPLSGDLPEPGDAGAEAAPELELEDEVELDEIFTEPSASVDLEFAQEPEGEMLDSGDNGEEKISLRTRSMAEVLAEQGDIKGALDIYHELSATAADEAEAEDIRRRMATLTAKLETPEPVQAGGESEKLIGMLEALAKRVEARAAN